MAAIEKFLNRLKERQPAFAIEALTQASNHRDAFEYGRMSGILQGLKMAETLLEEVLEEEDGNSKKRPQLR